MNIDFATSGRDVRTVMVTSAVEGEGKSTTAANLAVTLARAGRNVVLVDADFLRPSQADLFSIAARPGLVQVVTREAALADALTRVGTSLPSARRDDNSVRGHTHQRAGGDVAHAHVSDREQTFRARSKRDCVRC